MMEVVQGERAPTRRSVLRRLVRYGQLEARISLFCAPPAMGLVQRRAMPPFEELWATSMLPGSAVLHGGKAAAAGRWRVPSRTVAGHSQAGLPRREACPFSDACLDREHVHGLRAIAGVEHLGVAVGGLHRDLVTQEEHAAVRGLDNAGQTWNLSPLKPSMVTGVFVQLAPSLNDEDSVTQFSVFARSQLRS